MLIANLHAGCEFEGMGHNGRGLLQSYQSVVSTLLEMQRLILVHLFITVTTGLCKDAKLKNVSERWNLRRSTEENKLHPNKIEKEFSEVGFLSRVEGVNGERLTDQTDAITEFFVDYLMTQLFAIGKAGMQLSESNFEDINNECLSEQINEVVEVISDFFTELSILKKTEMELSSFGGLNNESLSEQINQVVDVISDFFTELFGLKNEGVNNESLCGRINEVKNVITDFFTELFGLRKTGIELSNSSFPGLNKERLIERLADRLGVITDFVADCKSGGQFKE